MAIYTEASRLAAIEHERPVATDEAIDAGRAEVLAALARYQALTLSRVRAEARGEQRASIRRRYLDAADAVDAMALAAKREG